MNHCRTSNVDKVNLKSVIVEDVDDNRVSTIPEHDTTDNVQFDEERYENYDENEAEEEFKSQGSQSQSQSRSPLTFDSIIEKLNDPNLKDSVSKDVWNQALQTLLHPKSTISPPSSINKNISSSSSTNISPVTSTRYTHIGSQTQNGAIYAESNPNAKSPMQSQLQVPTTSTIRVIKDIQSSPEDDTSDDSNNDNQNEKQS